MNSAPIQGCLNHTKSHLSRARSGNLDILAPISFRFKKAVLEKYNIDTSNLCASSLTVKKSALEQ